MAKYKKKPSFIEAVQYTGTKESVKEVIDFLGVIPEIFKGCETDQYFLKITNSDGKYVVHERDYIIIARNGSMGVWSEKAFELEYEVIK